MLFTSLLFIFILGAVACVAVAGSLIAHIPFSPFIFPAVFMLSGLAAILFAPRARAILAIPEDTGERGLRPWLREHWLYLILIPAVTLLLFRPAVQLGYHGPFHSAYIYQIIQRGLPPENVTLPGYPANDYWPYHVYLAILTLLLNAPPTFASAVSNILMLGMTLLWLGALWKKISPAASSALYVLFPVLGSNLFYILNVSIAQWIRLPAQWTPDARLDLPLIRFINFNGFPVGVLIFIVTLYISLRCLRDGFTWRDGFLLVFLGGSALLYHATTGIFLFAVLAPALILSRLLDRSHSLPPASAWTRNGSALAGWILFSILFLLPVGIFLLRSSSAMAVRTSFELISTADLASIFVVVYPVSIFFILGLRRAWIERDISALFLSMVALWGFLLAVWIRLPDGNEYKFIHLSSIAFNLVALLAIKEWVVRSATWGRALLAVLTIAMAGNALLGTWKINDVYAHRHDIPVAYMDTHVLIGREDFAPFIWIRDHTPADTVIVQPLTSKDWNYGYFSERLPYVVAGHIYNEGIPETAVRQEQLERLYDPALPVEERIGVVRSILEAVHRPVVVIYFANRDFNAAMERTFGARGEWIGKNIIIYLLSAP